MLSTPGALRLFASAVVGRAPQGMSSLAILLLVRETTHSYAAAGLAVGVNALASAASAPVVGQLIDKFGRSRVLVPFAAVQAGCFVALVLAAAGGAGAAVLIGLSALAGWFLPPIAPVVRALLREVFEASATLDTAYALDAIFQELVWIGGPLVVALVIEATSASVAVVMQGAVVVLGTSLFVRSPLVRGAAPAAALHSRGSAIASPGLRALLAPVLLMGVGLGAIEVGLPSLALHDGSRGASGLLLALWSLGSISGGLLYGARVWGSPLAERYRVLLLALLILTLPLIAARSLAAGIVCAWLAGLAIAPVFSCQYALAGRSVKTGSETEAFTWMSAALIGGLAAGSAAGGAVIGPAGVSAPFVLSCVATMLAATVALSARARIAQTD